DISLNSISKWEARDYPTVYDNCKKLNKNAKLTTFSFAAMLVLYSGKSEVVFEPKDTPEFVEFIQSSFDASNIKAWVSGIVNHKQMWNEHFAEVPHFIDEVSADVQLILEKKMQVALKQIIA
ncbi:MAG: hypothetical protein RL662_510, partial [Bacteroidota bacterium]